MNELFIIPIFLAIGLALAGPVAFIMVMVLLNKVGSLQRRIDRIEFKGYEPPVQPKPTPVSPPISMPVQKPVQPKPPVYEPVSETSAFFQPSAEVPAFTETSIAMDYLKKTIKKPTEGSSLEVKIGVTVALIVGVITVIIGVGFFLKYMVENMTFPPAARVCLVAAGGLVALVIGEITRRRDFEIVAKGISALGFALLYAAVFSGHKVYGLIETPWAFAAAIGITAGAMLYAVFLDEVLIAFLSLLGGYLSPILITTERALPIQFFGYVLVLSLGAMAAALFRRWRAVNWMAFAGTFILYTLWFEEFYRSDQMSVPLFWLGLFGGIYLLLPILHGLIRKLIARSEDVGLVVVNSMVVFYYLWRMLYPDYQKQLALSVAAIGIVHLVIVAVSVLRCRDDVKLQSALGVLGTAFITASIPLYFTSANPMLIGWAIEAVVLTFIGIRYQAIWVKAMSLIAAGIASGALFYHLPLHDTEEFRVILNTRFGIWVFVSLSIVLCHALWRFLRPKEDAEAELLAQVYFVWGRILLAIGIALEWYAHCDWHIEYVRQSESYILMGITVIAAALFIGFLVRPLCPRGDFVRTVGIMSAVIGAVYTAIAMGNVYYDDFIIFANVPFMIVCIYVFVMLLGAWFVRDSRPDSEMVISQPAVLVMTALILFWVLLSEEIYLFWYCGHEYGDIGSNWEFLAQMYLSVLWAIYAAILLVLGFVFRARGIRYLSMAIFAVLLGKIFVIDTATLRTEYRIAAFLTTGLVLVGVSFLYQFLKKKGFFDSLEKIQIENGENK